MLWTVVRMIAFVPCTLVSIVLDFLLFLLYESKSELINNLLAQALVAIATASGGRKRKRWLAEHTLCPAEMFIPRQ